MPAWEDLLAPTEGGGREKRTLPWVGGRLLIDNGRTWNIKGQLPVEHGWYVFNVTARRDAKLGDRSRSEADPTYEQGHKLHRGYLIGDRFIPDTWTGAKNIDDTQVVWLVEPGLDRIVRCLVADNGVGDLIFIRQEFPEGSDQDAIEAYQDRRSDLGHLKGVTPALDLAFRFVSFVREQEEKLQREAEERRLAEERAAAEAARLEALMKDIGTGAGRRALAQRDFATAARAALALSGAELLDTKPNGRRVGEMVVQYRFQQRRLECVVDLNLRVTDAGVCLTDHRTGVKGDTLFTLESLPTVIGEALRLGKLVVYRHP